MVQVKKKKSLKKNQNNWGCLCPIKRGLKNPSHLSLESGDPLAPTKDVSGDHLGTPQSVYYS